MALLIDYTPPPTGVKFMNSEAKMRVLMGPVGSAKSVTSCFEIIRRGSMQVPNKQGIRKTRFAVVRETARQLADTTIKTFLDWFPPGVCGHYMRTTKTFFFKLGDVEIEVMFRALDDTDDVANLNSLELTGAWFNECRDIHPEIIDAMSKRIGRFPSKKDGGPTWYGMWGDTNPPTMDSWWYYQMEKLDPKDGASANDNGWEVFKQPSGRSIYAENVENLPDGYYDTQGRSEEYIRVFIDGEYGLSSAGMPVYKYFRPDYHMARMRLSPIVNGGRPLIIGMDLGLCYSDDTEVLTAAGWKLFKDVDEHTDQVATLNPKTFELEYTQINFKVAKPWKGELIQFKGQNFDFLVTPEHRTPFTHRDTPKVLRFTSAEALTGQVTAHRFIQLTAGWSGIGYSLLGLPEDMSMQFWGWYLSEGSCEQLTPNSYRINISQIKPAPDLDALMVRPEWQSIGMVWRKHAVGWRGSHSGLGQLVRSTGRAADRTLCVPRALWTATSAGAQLFIMAYVHGDGHVRTKTRVASGVGRKARNEITAFTTSPLIKDDLQELALLAGWCSSARAEKGRGAIMKDGRVIPPSDGWTIAFKRLARAEIKARHITRVAYDGMVYCLNVPHHTLYVRRSGRPCWNGNTPAAVIGQQDPRGRALILGECVSFDMGVQRFIRSLLRPYLFERFPGMPVFFVVDPAGTQRAQTDERSAVDIIKQEGFRVVPARTNVISARLNAVDDYLMRQVDGDSAFVMDPSCTNLKAAMMGGYRYKPKGDGEIDKGKLSHVAEALQYLMLHLAVPVSGHMRTVRRDVKVVQATGWT